MTDYNFSDEQFDETVDFIKKRIKNIPNIALVLGSGLGPIADEIEDKIVIPYKDIPNFPVSTVPGHKGELIFGKLKGRDIIAMNGRFHWYEGYTMQEVTYPIRVFSLLGVKSLILTNAAGAINPKFSPGDVMVIRDQNNLFLPDNPLRGRNLERFGPRFPDMSRIYDEDYQEILVEALNDDKDPRGVYAFAPGPNYESPDDIQALKQLGVDAVGMSTVPEAIVARHCGMKVAGISTLCNMAAGIVPNQTLSHEEVTSMAQETGPKCRKIVKSLVTKI